MKKNLYIMLLFALVLCGACNVDSVESEGYQTYPLSIQVAYPSSTRASGQEWSLDGITVSLSDTYGSLFDAKTDETGTAKFSVPVGIYEATASISHSDEGYVYNYNVLQSGIVVTGSTDSTGSSEGINVSMSFTESVSGQIVIKELYIGGCQRVGSSSAYSSDKYCILYNNSDQTASVDNLCFGFVLPLNAHATNNNYDSDGNFSFESEGFIPAGYAIWHMQNTFTLEPGEQAVIAIYGAINHKEDYPNSVDLSNADYCMYDPLDYNQSSSSTYYPAPSANIPTDHYLLAEKYGYAASSSWPIGNYGPGFYIFATEDMTPAEFANQMDYWYNGGSTAAASQCLKVPVDWILDGMEVYNEQREASSRKRLTSAVDAGYTLLTNSYGHTSYRNVDQEATEALEENEGLLIYNYAYGDDPSGIDAEASLKNGARIIYKDTNNSTNDFHQRSQASLND